MFDSEGSNGEGCIVCTEQKCEAVICPAGFRREPFNTTNPDVCCQVWSTFYIFDLDSHALCTWPFKLISHNHINCANAMLRKKTVRFYIRKQMQAQCTRNLGHYCNWASNERFLFWLNIKLCHFRKSCVCQCTKNQRASVPDLLNQTVQNIKRSRLFLRMDVRNLSVVNFLCHWIFIFVWVD